MYDIFFCRFIKILKHALLNIPNLKKISIKVNRRRWNNLTLIGNFPARAIYEKLIQSKLMSSYSVLFKFDDENFGHSDVDDIVILATSF